jgi:chemotaxis protein methyltransferase CheR
MSLAMPLAARDEYTEFCAGVQRLCQIDLMQYKRSQMERRIRSFAERRGMAGLPEYLVALREQQCELSDFLDRVTINVSQLWRNPSLWETLRADVIPELAAGRRLRAWSAGCSYGAEAYTLAAVVREVAPLLPIEILGIDIDERMIERARAARFDAADARDVPPASLARWFEPDGDDWQAKAQLRACVRFEVGDLLAMPMRSEAFDLILCRNTVIYFTETVRDALHTRLAQALRSGGYLVVGSTERVARPEERELQLVHPFTYRKN